MIELYLFLVCLVLYLAPCILLTVISVTSCLFLGIVNQTKIKCFL